MVMEGPRRENLQKEEKTPRIDPLETGSGEPEES